MLPVFASLGDFADIDFGIKIGRKRFPMLPGIAVNNIQIMNLVKVMLGGISRKDPGHSRIETTSQNGCESCGFEAVMVRPLPFVFEFGDIGGFIIGGIEIMDTCLKTSLHQG